jgi:ABC-type uncharacterized transport system involved in gliding motility auxiliary subunit
VLQPVEGAKTKFEPLISTSTDSEQIPAEKLVGMPDVAGLLHDFKPDDKKLTLAAHITGPAATAFPDGPPKPEAKPGEEPQKDDQAKDDKPAADAKSDAKPGDPQLKEAAQPINVVVVADSDMLADRFWVQTSDFFGQRVAVPNANNADLVANAIEVLAGGNDLISLRTRGTSARPFEVVQTLQRDADSRYSAQEKELQDKLKDTQAKIKDLQSDKSGKIVLTAEQTSTLDNFRKEMVQTRQQLRDVQLRLNQDIRRLKSRLVFADVALIPILLVIVAIILGIVRLQRRKRRAVHG